MSDEREGADAADTGADSTDTGGQTAVGTQPLRPTGKRTRRGAAAEATDETSDAGSSVREDDGEKKRGRSKKTATKPAKKPKDGPSRNPFLFVWNYLQEVIAELRKVIWPNRKEMVGYTIVVLIFLVFMVTLIGVTDLGLGRLVMTVFG